MARTRRAAAQKLAVDKAAERDRMAREGFVYAVVWTLHHNHGPLFFRTLEEATGKRDEMIKENAKAIPNDYYDRQASLVKLTVSIEHFSGSGWVSVSGSQAECVYEVKYADGR